MQRDTAFKVNTPNVVADVIDNEGVIVNLGRGLYYSLDPVGAMIWDFIASGHTVADMSRALVTRYSIDAGESENALLSLLNELVEEQLITPHPGSPSRPISSTEADQSAGAFSPPKLTKYDDMEELLQLDPIHDVDDLGWPVVKTNEE